MIMPDKMSPPRGDPESRMRLPDQTIRVWNTLTEEEHRILAEILRNREEYQKRNDALMKELKRNRPGTAESLYSWINPARPSSPHSH
jgi:hypothetical protein